MIRLALDFWTWERLEADGLEDGEKAELMTDAIGAIAGVPATAR